MLLQFYTGVKLPAAANLPDEILCDVKRRIFLVGHYAILPNVPAIVLEQHHWNAV